MSILASVQFNICQTFCGATCQATVLLYHYSFTPRWLMILSEIVASKSFRQISSQLCLPFSLFPSDLGTECICFVIWNPIDFEVQSVLLPAPTGDWCIMKLAPSIKLVPPNMPKVRRQAKDRDILKRRNIFFQPITKNRTLMINRLINSHCTNQTWLFEHGGPEVLVDVATMHNTHSMTDLFGKFSLSVKLNIPK